MNIAIAADHAGYQLKEELKDYLQSKNHQVEDVGAFSDESVDYPDFAKAAAMLVADGKADKAILVCGSGIGMAMAANKIKSIRAANCQSVECAVLSRKHNDANVLCLGSRLIDFSQAKKLVSVWLKEPFEGGRHLRRVEKIDG